MKNSKISDDDELVESITTYSLRPIVLHGYILPFIFLYSGCLSLYLFEIVEEAEPFFIVLGAIVCLQILTGLFCHWSVHVRCLLTCTQVPNTSDATLAKVVPLPNNGSPELVNLRRSPGNGGSIYFIFQKSKYVWDGEERKQFEALLYPVEKMLKEYMDWKGLGSEEQIKTALDTYGDNSLVMDIPDFKDLFKERATAPFFVFQVFCVGLWCLDEYWYYSLFTLFMLIVFESTLVTQQIRNMQEIRKMGNKPDYIQVYRCNKWQAVISTDLLPGDIVSVSKGNKDAIIPCDMLLLRGPAVLDESMLTGESVPQMKESLEGVDLSRPLNMATDAKLHVLFGGTKLVQHTAPIKTQAHLKSPDNGVICYVLRTSFSSSQGRLLRTILYSVSRVTANNLESFIFILFLLVFAIAAASYVWIKGCEDPERNRYKLFLECTLILTSVVPPELPIELSLAVNSSLYSLSKLFVFCTEPFRIPFAGKIDVCCFDKTGTLTSDDLVVEGIAGLDGTSKVVPANETPSHTVQVIAACHSLISVNDKVVGDPQEKAALSAIDWDLTKSSVVVPKKGKAPGMKIVQRFHFSSQLKRMSVIASYSQPGSGEFTHIAAVKGAPEVIRKMLVSVPQKYDEVYLELSRRGARVLALARKELGQSHNEIREMSRQKIESGLTFQGFIIISCPIKRDSLSVIKEIQASSHGAVMITGDNPLTACHVAKELRFTRSSKTMMILEAYEDGEIGWKSIDHSKSLPVQPEFKTSREMKRQFLNTYDFCITGEGLTRIHQHHTEFFMKILPYVRVFARVAPKQKEIVITSYKKLGMTVLMCGDGTNDVGALKHADCGVAILSNAPDRANNLMTSAREYREKQKRFQENWHSRVADMRQKDKRDPKRQKPESSMALMKRMMDEMEEQESQMVKLGDASIAAPFTSRLSSIQCVVHIIKQGRCTLVTTLQMFKILALNALILAYAQSVLYLEGVRFSDGQATLQGLLLASCFLFISRSKPLKVLSKERPPPSIFNPYTVLTVLLQFSIHFGCLYFLVSTAYTFEPKDPTQKIDLEKKFAPSILNSTVYIMSLALQICTFAINYRGHPYMASLSENSPLLLALVSTGGLVMALAMGIIPDFAEYFEIVDFPPQFRKILCQVLLADLSLCYIIDRVLKYSCGEGKLRSALRH